LQPWNGNLQYPIFSAAAGKGAPVMTPLMIYVRQQRAARSMAQVY
jgi:hypothetical protein